MILLKCEYSSIPMSWRDSRSANDDKDTYSVGDWEVSKEWINKEAGYHKENMLLVCNEFNPGEYFMEIVDGVQGWDKDIVGDFCKNIPQNYDIKRKKIVRLTDSQFQLYWVLLWLQMDCMGNYQWKMSDWWTKSLTKRIKVTSNQILAKYVTITKSI